MTDLKSTIPPDPTGLLRARCKYTHPKTSIYILAFFIDRIDGSSIAEWSLLANDHDNTKLIEDQITPFSDFIEMLKEWNYCGCEFVPSK